jgi:hypothetical protein
VQTEAAGTFQGGGCCWKFPSGIYGIYGIYHLEPEKKTGVSNPERKKVDCLTSKSGDCLTLHVGFAEMKLGILTISQGLAPSWSSEPIQI